MVRLKVKDRGRDLSVHEVERQEEAHEIRRVYELLGYAPDKIVIEVPEENDRRAA